MKLIGTPTSPYARKVRMLALEKGIALDWEIDLPFDPATKVPQYNPLGKVPVLVLDDGVCLYDSRVIAQYLDTLPGPCFLPISPAARIAVLRQEALADGITDAVVAVVMEGRRPPDLQWDAWVARQQGKIAAGLQALAAELGTADYLGGDTPHLGDLAAGAMLGFLSFRLPAYPWQAQHPDLARYQERLLARDAFRTTVPVG